MADLGLAGFNVVSSNAGASAPPAKRQRTNALDVLDVPNVPNCDCGQPAVRFVTKKPGPNQGRAFYKCPKRMNDNQCRFFEWEDKAKAASVPVKPVAKRSGQVIPEHAPEIVSVFGENCERLFNPCLAELSVATRQCALDAVSMFPLEHVVLLSPAAATKLAGAGAYVVVNDAVVQAFAGSLGRLEIGDAICFLPRGEAVSVTNGRVLYSLPNPEWTGTVAEVSGMRVVFAAVVETGKALGFDRVNRPLK